MSFHKTTWLCATLTLAACGTQVTPDVPPDEPEVGREEDTTDLAFACASPLPAEVSATDDDGNEPEQSMDGSLTTRWSCHGKGCAITYDMGASLPFCGAGIAWYNGSSRKNTFEIALSEDNASFTTVFSGQSSGTTKAAEAYAFTGSGRYMRVTVYGNTKNEWASITEVEVAAGMPDPGGGDPGGGTDPGGGSGIGGSVDENGVAYVPIAGYEYVSERFDWTKNFKSNGSRRHDFENAPDSNQCVVGYFWVTGPGDEEISAKLASGPHSSSNPGYADTYDLGLINFAGTRARLRYEATHPSYDNGPSKSVNIGDVRNRWVGAMGCKLNADSNGDGTPDTARILGYVDTSGFDAAGKPQNQWVPTLDLSIPFSEVELKSPAVPYVVTIGKASLSQATIRIDGQGSSYKYQYIAYRKLAPL